MKKKINLKQSFISCGDETCFCPSGIMMLVDEDDGVYYCQDGTKVLKLAEIVETLSNPIVLKLCDNRSKNAYLCKKFSPLFTFLRA